MRRGMRRVARTGLLSVAILVIAWLVLHLVGSSAPAPVAADRADEELPTLVVRDATEIPGHVRDTAPQGEPVRVRLTPESTGGESPQEFWCRALTEPEKAQAMRMVATIRKTTDKLFDVSSVDSVDDEVTLANLLKTRSMCDAVMPQIEAGESFLVKGMPPALKSDADWHYWNMHMRTKAEGEVVLCVPIDLAKNPDVRHYRERATAMRAFTRSQDARRWNTLSHEVRRSMLDAAEASRAALGPLEAEFEQVPRDSQENGAAAGRGAELWQAIRALRAILAKVPPYVDPVTLDWGPR